MGGFVQNGRLQLSLRIDILLLHAQKLQRNGIMQDFPWRYLLRRLDRQSLQGFLVFRQAHAFVVL